MPIPTIRLPAPIPTPLEDRIADANQRIDALASHLNNVLCSEDRDSVSTTLRTLRAGYEADAQHVRALGSAHAEMQARYRDQQREIFALSAALARFQSATVIGLSPVDSAIITNLLPGPVTNTMERVPDGELTHADLVAHDAVGTVPPAQAVAARSAPAEPPRSVPLDTAAPVGPPAVTPVQPQPMVMLDDLRREMERARDVGGPAGLDRVRALMNQNGYAAVSQVPPTQRVRIFGMLDELNATLERERRDAAGERGRA